MFIRIKLGLLNSRCQTQKRCEFVFCIKIKSSLFSLKDFMKLTPAAIILGQSESLKHINKVCYTFSSGFTCIRWKQVFRLRWEICQDWNTKKQLCARDNISHRNTESQAKFSPSTLPSTINKQVIIMTLKVPKTIWTLTSTSESVTTHRYFELCQEVLCLWQHLHDSETFLFVFIDYFN